MLALKGIKRNNRMWDSKVISNCTNTADGTYEKFIFPKEKN